MTYTYERDRFIVTMAREGLDLDTTRALLRAATTLHRYAELACSSEAADRDRVECPRAYAERKYACKSIAVATKAFTDYPCLCDDYATGKHSTVTRITVQGDRLERRLAAQLAKVGRRVLTDEDRAMRTLSGGQDAPNGWSLDFQGDPRGSVLRVIPPSFADRNKGRPRHNLDTIGVPSAPSRLRF